MSTVEAQLRGLKTGSGGVSKGDYIGLLRVTGTDDLDADELRNVVRVCEAAGITLAEFEIDRSLANTIHLTEETARGESHHREQCKILSGKIRDLAGVLPRQVRAWIDQPYDHSDRRVQIRKREEVKQINSELIRHQSLLRQSEGARISLKTLREKHWWMNEFTNTESE